MNTGNNSREITLRKTFGLNEPGCSVNCNYCTLGTQYVGEWNQNHIRDGVENDVRNFHEAFPDLECHIELVGYWHGINNQIPEFERLIGVIERTRDLGYPIIGGDLGIISDEGTLRDLREAGLTYLHNNLETSRRLYPIAIGRNVERFEQKVETLRLADNCGLATTSGVLIGLGEGIEDLTEQVHTLRELPISRVAVNFMDYETDPRIGRRFADAQEQLTPEYALHVLSFLRNHIRPNQSLMVGFGVSGYLYDEENFSELLSVVDTIHIGSFINLRNPDDGQGVENLLARLDEMNYSIAASEKIERR